MRVYGIDTPTGRRTPGLFAARGGRLVSSFPDRSPEPPMGLLSLAVIVLLLLIYLLTAILRPEWF